MEITLQPKPPGYLPAPELTDPQEQICGPCQDSSVNPKAKPSAKPPSKLQRSGNITDTTAWHSTDTLNKALALLIPVPSTRKWPAASCQLTGLCRSGQSQAGSRRKQRVPLLHSPPLRSFMSTRNSPGFECQTAHGRTWLALEINTHSNATRFSHNKVLTSERAWMEKEASINGRINYNKFTIIVFLMKHFVCQESN